MTGPYPRRQPKRAPKPPPAAHHGPVIRAVASSSQPIDLRLEAPEPIAPIGDSSISISKVLTGENSGSDYDESDDNDDDDGDSLDDFVVYTDESEDEAMVSKAPRKSRAKPKPKTKLKPKSVLVPTPQARMPAVGDPKVIAPPVSSCSVPIPQPAPAPAVDSIRTPLDAYGEAVIRCSLDHTPSTAAKLESDIVEASQKVIDYHKAAIIVANQDLQKALQAKENRLQSALNMNEILRGEQDELSTQVHNKDKELKEKERELWRYKASQAEEEKKKKSDESKVKELEQEMEAKRKRVLESWEASKKAKV